ncbi:hypothetical protein V2J44_02475 [Staphylococcus saccharolyticus]|uniref:hypothetical protein n=1 Tax=Staphylococcus saccharolyticus TaxID=33028 RepID=UPI0026BE17DB
MDEATLSDENLIYEINQDNEIKHYTIHVKAFGLSYAGNERLQGGSPRQTNKFR